MDPRRDAWRALALVVVPSAMIACSGRGTSGSAGSTSSAPPSVVPAGAPTELEEFEAALVGQLALMRETPCEALQWLGDREESLDLDEARIARTYVADVARRCGEEREASEDRARERAARISELAAAPCTLERAAEELTLDVVDGDDPDAVFRRCVWDRIETCQRALDELGPADATACWTERAWPEVPSELSRSDVLVAAACLSSIAAAEEAMTECIEMEAASDLELIERYNCIFTNARTLLEASCPPLDTSRRTLEFEDRLGYVAASTTAETLAFGAACRLSISDAQDAIAAGSSDLAQNRLESADKACRGKDEVAHVKKVRKALAKLQKKQAKEAKRIAKCGGATPLELYASLENGFSVKKAKGCKYQVPYMSIQYHQRSKRRFVVNIGNDEFEILVILHSSEDFVDGAVLYGRTVSFVGLEDVLLEGEWKDRHLPAFKLK